jgi:hypothetical protein
VTRLTRAALPIGLLGLVALALPTHSTAAARSIAHCRHTWIDSISPGVSMKRQKVDLTSNGETGTIRCRGFVEGKRVTGPGTFGEVGTFDGTCAGGTGSATFSFTLPTTAGPVKLRIPVTFTVMGFGSTTSDVFPGKFLFDPLAGNCLTAPITRIRVFRAGTLKT